MKRAAIAASAAILGSGVTGVAPWPVVAFLGMLGALVYIYRLRVIQDLGRRALDKSTPEGVPSVMSTITGGELTLDPLPAKGVRNGKKKR
ncbi:hypothetical protein [Saccharothrix hoggarensis]|uniref:Uncharacterized protein n=1 Tax=Saccharothrix hoggarensis TaxID=913853 RepID=A0ABW3R5A5_9PSEU